MSTVQAYILSETSAAIEDEEVYLPSFFSPSERAEMSLLELEKEELELRRAQIVECIMQLRRSAKKLSSARAQKKKDGRGQYEGSRSATQRHILEFNQECLLLIYNTGRKAFISLSDDEHIGEAFPALSTEDLFRKSTTEKRQLGDSRRSDGRLWGVGARATLDSATSVPPSDHLSASPSTPTAPAQTQHTTSESSNFEEDPPGDRAGENGRRRETADEERIDGKLWSPVLGLSIAEVEEWDHEGKHYYDRKYLCADVAL